MIDTKSHLYKNLIVLLTALSVVTIGVMSVLNAQAAPVGLVAAYGFNEGSGVAVTDASGNSNTGAVSGATWTTSGRYDSALSFNGSNNRVDINDANSLDLTTGMTLEAWVYPASVSGWRTVILKEVSGGLTYALYASDNASRPAVYINTGGSDIFVSGTASLSLNTWTHLAATYDGSTLRLFVNGTQVGSRAASGSIRVSTNPLRIGGNTIWGEYFNGRIDEVRVYSRALSQAEIQTDMNTAVIVLPADTTPPTAPANLTATAAGSSQINLSWSASTDNVGVTGYQIERCQGAGCSSFSQITTTTTTTYNNTSLLAGTSYSYRVRATDAANNLSGYSNTASATTLDTLTLTSIAVTPANQTITNGATQQFTATGTYSDSSTQNISSQATWSSSNTGVATITSSGLATTVSAGSTTISATLSGVTGNTNLTVQVTPLTITTTSLPNGTLNVSYAATLAASGGTPPYTWSISIGSLPVGLTLNTSTGGISGTPTTAGTFNFTVKVTDTSNPNQNTTKALSITVSAQANSTIWPGTTVPGVADSGPDSSVELGVKFRSDSSGNITGVRFYKATTNTGTHVGNLWSSTGTLLATAIFTNETASGWQQVLFSNPVAITANTVYVASYHATTGHYSADVNYFATTGVDSPPLHALANGVSGGNGVFAYGSTSSFPNQTWNTANYWVDVVFSTTPTATLTSIAVTPANQTITNGATQQFTATGTYSDSSTQNISSQATWSSSNTGVATITSSGLATTVSAGSTTISATLSGVTGNTNLTVQVTPLTITTTSLPNGTLNVSYAATLAASGGTPPYTWSISIGSLPVGLTLNTSTGGISGTPTTAGTFNFTVKVTDTSNPNQNTTKALSITVSAQANSTIWPGTTVPGVADSGPDSSVELGVKFRSDSSGNITGVRFYKATTNTGTHVGNLWSSTGTLLATAIFTNETASGWQQVLFSNPVAITANTVYVASYHATTGHYSADVNYFATTGVDNPPLHALANGVSGGNGVYAYGSTSNFPNQTWNTSNYWVDVVFSTTPTATLTSIAVTPANQTITNGATQQFTATGTYSDSSTQNITSQATWSSSNTGVATINSAGLATAVSAGSTTISATLSGVTGNTNLTVQVTPLTITTTSLPNGTLNVSYSATLAASGGTPPYTWSISSGSLPAGLSLNTSTGGISGTPTTTGTFNFTVQVTDTSNPNQTTTKALSITVSAQSNSTIWPGTTVPGVADSGPDSSVELGVKFRSDSSGNITGVRFYKATTNTGTHVGNLWSSTGTLLATAIFTNETASGWQQVLFSNPVAITANTVYVASYHATTGHYSADVNYFATTGVDNPPLHALANGVSGGNGVYAYGSTSNFPNQTWNTSNYWVDVVFSTTPTATLTSIAVTPANQTITNGATQQFTATGTYSDGSTQNITSQATWSSSNTGVATINSAGLATAVSAGSTSISATLSGVTGNTNLTVQPIVPIITSTSLPDGTQYAVYSAAVSASGGTTPYTWSILSGSLPTGLSLNSGHRGHLRNTHG